MITQKNIVLKNVEEPVFKMPRQIPKLDDSVYEERLKKVLVSMTGRKYDYLVMYADREHFSNFEYLTGFEPRFEEAILVLRGDGKAWMFLGNECYNMHRNSRLKVEGILYQALSLPSQPIEQLNELSGLLSELGIAEGKRVGLVGWKLMYPRYGDSYTFDVPSYIAEAVKTAAGKENVTNATDLFIHPEYGVRIQNSAAEIARLEFGAAWASDGVQKMLAGMKTGMSELEVSRCMRSEGMEQSCFPMMSSGERNSLGLVSPSDRIIKLGDSVNCCQGLRGGLTCRTGYAVYSEEDLPYERRDYVEKLAAPYFATVVNWFSAIKIGASAGDVFEMVQNTFPKETYGWVLNPGHFIGTEEWLSSPFYSGSTVTIKSGMCIQMDIIPGMEGYAGANCEDGFVVADDALREEIKQKYPEMFSRMQQRRHLAKEVVGIPLADEILPLSNLLGLYRPYFLNHNLAFAVEAEK